MIQSPLRLLFTALIALMSMSSAYANDGIFPPAPAAANAINFDGKGFLINGQRTFIASGGMEYARVPRALWRDRLLRMKRAGFNCTETYIFWNFHEPKENQWSFSGDYDLNAYLQLVHQLGMYAIVRIGPYVCAEWDSGGYPVWLRFKPGIVVRADNQPFLDETFKYYDKILPIIASNQINHGGAVILVQVENENSGGWGTDSSTYEQKLRTRVLADGIEVPTFFSGLHHGSDPAGNTPWDDATRQNPWFTTEFWANWYSAYGAGNPDFWTRGTWKILAFGGNGYNYYMLHGGTNFDTYNDNEDASSYDYGAGIGQAGDLRPLYYKQKEAAMFANTFQSILENSVSSTAQFASIATNPSVNEYARTAPSGTIVFLDNPSKSDITTQITGGRGANEPAVGAATIPEQKMLPVVEHFELTPSITIDQSVTQILTSVTQGSNTTLVVYGPSGGNGSIELSSTQPLNLVSGTGWKSSDPTHGSVQIAYPTDGVSSTILGSGTEKLQILSMSEGAAERTWAVPSDRGTDLIVGPDYVGETIGTGGTKNVQVEFTSANPAPVLDCTPDLKLVTLQTSPQEEVAPSPPALTNWLQKSVDEAQPKFDDTAWLASDEPPFMGADGDYSAYAWYRTTFAATNAGTKYLIPDSVGDRMIVFVDGVRLPSTAVSTKSAQLDLTTGTHSLAILTAHYGRGKLFGYSGPVDKIEGKGLGSPVVLSDQPKLQLVNWQSQPVVKIKPDITTLPSATDPNWSSVKLGTDVFNKAPGWAWFQTVIPATPNQSPSDGETIHFDSVDDNGTVFCNGKLVGTHQGWNTGFDIDLKPAWLPGQKNVITVLDENTDGAGGISGSVTLQSASSDGSLHGWKMRGGVGDPGNIMGWQPLSATNGVALPTFYSAHFIGVPPTLGAGAYPILRVHLGGMSAGFVWLNGHNLGRYPEKIKVDGLYLPECWINKGDNTLVIFDEDGQQPTDVKLITETAASRYGFTVTN